MYVRTRLLREPELKDADSRQSVILVVQCKEVALTISIVAALPHTFMSICSESRRSTRTAAGK